MPSDSNYHSTANAPDDNLEPSTQVIRSKPPRLILEGLYAFAPNRETLGGTSYFIVENTGNILIDCPAWENINQQFLINHGVRWLFLTHRGGISKQLKLMQSVLNCEVIIQEQEAYLLPEVPLTSFVQEILLNSHYCGVWTPGHSPGSSCFYWPQHGGVLFSGRHLLPNQQGQPVPLRTAKTFHWWRQLKSVAALRDRFSPETLNYLCPGANTGFLRGKGFIEQAYHQLEQLNLEQLRQAPIFELFS
ncbi:beta-lactamase-like protein [Gloeothece citriformis PCC 7424]|uniref:Beta-lactamase-like protein n=1 Tax=Gloeothece citriformis (strain PCC 7424) TaxID=65393 RepID=B7KL06_GLOC7|nr:hypothetical protein [Gloeothece citriformis]ACK72378.1 beta-lactamase-like protein [Gloeothece citriformis PCC 7424]